MTQEWFTAKELAGAPEFPATPQNTKAKLARICAKSRPRAGKGGGLEYHISSLPETTRTHLLRAATANAVQTVVERLPTPAEERQTVAEMTAEQRRVMTARLAICDAVDHLAARHDGKRGPAVREFLGLVEHQQLDESLQRTLIAANARSGRGRTINRSTLYRWLNERDHHGASAIAPLASHGHRIPDWMPRLLSLYQTPNKWPVAKCIREWSKQWPDDDAPNLRTAQSHLARLPVEVREYGRMGRNARRAIQPFVRRTTDGLWPMDVVTVDGHLFKAYARHPFTGRRFRPELTTYLDIATRCAIGFSAWIAESQYAIWIALREMTLNPGCGVPAIHYSDNGAYRGDQHRATLARIGTTIMFSQAYRAQARGVIERFNSSVWVPLARDHATYCGDDADAEALKKALRRADQAGDNVMGWGEFVADCRRALDEYNSRPHSHLKGQTPKQAWTKAVADGWRPTPLEQDDLHDLLPARSRKVRRGEITLPWGRYFSDDLVLYHDRDVVVHFDPIDGRKVWVADERGVLICEAIRDGNARPYVAESQLEHARAERAQGRLNRLERKADAIREEERGFIDVNPTPVSAAMVADTVALVEAQAEQDDLARLNEDPRRLHAYWLRIGERIAAGQPVDAEEQRGFAVYRRTRQYETQNEFFEEFGLEAADFS